MMSGLDEEPECPYCREVVTDQQIADGEAHRIDERGSDDGKWEHDECAREAKYGD